MTNSQDSSRESRTSSICASVLSLLQSLWHNFTSKYLQSFTTFRRRPDVKSPRSIDESSDHNEENEIRRKSRDLVKRYLMEQQSQTPSHQTLRPEDFDLTANPAIYGALAEKTIRNPYVSPTSHDLLRRTKSRCDSYTAKGWSDQVKDLDTLSKSLQADIDRCEESWKSWKWLDSVLPISVKECWPTYKALSDLKQAELCVRLATSTAKTSHAEKQRNTSGRHEILRSITSLVTAIRDSEIDRQDCRREELCVEIRKFGKLLFTHYQELTNVTRATKVQSYMITLWSALEKDFKKVKAGTESAQYKQAELAYKAITGCLGQGSTASEDTTSVYHPRKVRFAIAEKPEEQESKV